MINSQVNDVLARDRQRELLETARRVRLARQARQARQARPHRLRIRAGWWLVQAGIRLVLSADRPAPSPRGAVAPTHQ